MGLFRNLDNPPVTTILQYKLHPSSTQTPIKAQASKSPPIESPNTPVKMLSPKTRTDLKLQKPPRASTTDLSFRTNPYPLEDPTWRIMGLIKYKVIITTLIGV